jgi:Rieske 2Fe-2S family protein
MRGRRVSVSSLQPALPKRMYVDDAFWRIERERVLCRSWFCVGRLDDLGLDRPGRLAVVDVVGESVLVTRDLSGSLHAAYNVCRHRGSQVVPVDSPADAPACLAVGALRCPYHSWTYDLSGRLLKAPHTENVDDFDADAFGLHPVGVDAWGGFCFVHLTPDEARPLGDELNEAVSSIARYPLESLVRGLRLEYEVAANYKVLSENYNECYHCGPVHPELSRLVPSFGSGGRDLDWSAGVEHREGAWTFTMSGTTSRRPFAGLDPTELSRHKGALVHPNLWLSCSPDHVAAFTLWPRDALRTRVVCDLLFEPGAVSAADFDPADAGDLWDLVNRQDWAVCESVQRGMGSRAYREGWFAPMEDLAADIRRWLLPRLDAALDEEVGA